MYLPMNEGLPDGWVEATIDDCFADITNGTTLTQNKNGIGIPVSRIETIQSSKFDMKRVQHLSTISVDKVQKYRYINGDLAFSHINSLEHVGKVALYEGDPEIFIHGMNLLRLRLGHNYIIPKFAYYQMLANRFREAVRERVNFAVNQVSINQKNLGSISFLIPPLAEQARIVTVLDGLLGRVRTAQEQLATVPKLLKRFRQGVLSAAVSGKLTEAWREENLDLQPIDLSSVSNERERLQRLIAKEKGQKAFKYKTPVELDLGGKTKGIDELFELPNTWQWMGWSGIGGQWSC